MNDKLYNFVSKSPFLKRAAPKFGLAMLKVKDVSPDVLFIFGIGAGVAAGVMVAKAYKKHEDVMDEPIFELDEARYALYPEDQDDYDEPSRKLVAKTLAPAYGKVAGSYIRLYGPSLAMGMFSLYLLASSHGIIKGRNKALLATVQVLERGFSTYRNRVREEFGGDADERMLHGADSINVVTVSENEGKKVKTKSKENSIPEEYDPSLYARVFDASVPEFSPDKDLNLFYLRANETHMNNMLQYRGYVLLNDVYDALNLSRTAEGCVVGWALNSPGDNVIDFGLDKPINKNIGDNRFILDFNVNGVVMGYVG